MATPSPVASQDPLLDRLAEFSTARLRTSFLLRHRELWEAGVVESLYARIVRVARVDLQRADRLARAARWIADKLDDAAPGQSLRHRGTSVFQGSTRGTRGVRGRGTLFRHAGRNVDVARTLNGALQVSLPWQVRRRAEVCRGSTNPLRTARGGGQPGSSRQQRRQHQGPAGPFEDALALYAAHTSNWP